MAPPASSRPASALLIQGRGCRQPLQAALAGVAFLALVQCGRQESLPPASDASPPASDTAVTTSSGLGPGGALAPAPPPGRLHPALTLPAASGFPLADSDVRDFDNLTPGQLLDFTRLQDSFWATSDPAQRAEILDEIESSCYGAGILPLVEKILALDDPDLRQRAIAMLSGNTSADILPILHKALADPSADVRLEAVAAAAQVRDDALLGYLDQVFADAEPAVRHMGLEILDNQPQNRSLQGLDRALQSPHADVQSAAVDLLQVDSTARSVEVLFSALDAPNPEVRAEAQFSLSFLLDQEFTSATEARTWWQANKKNFDAQLAPVD